MTNNIDPVDRKLISELVKDARQPYTILSKKIGVNPVTTKRRVRRLINEHIIDLEMIPDTGKLNYHTVALIGIHTQLPKLQYVAEQLKAKAPVVYLTLTSGRYDMLMSAIFESPAQLADFVSQDMASIDGLEWTETMINLKVSKDISMPAKKSSPVSRGLDNLDKRLILALLDDIRLPFAGLAEKLGISVPTVRQRVGRLVNEGIVSFSAVPNPENMGFQTIAHMGLRVQLSKINDVMAQLGRKQNVQYLAMTAGRYDVVAWCFFKSSTDLTTFLQKDLAAVDGITQSETFINLQAIKRSFEGILRSV
ncbi:MAG: Lrp/AsnC family transcriptional regulator [Chloroflexi bacterium]|nr:Lrp/AsnC family transcriptional regulator [Chloroflexota bacterium]